VFTRTKQGANKLTESMISAGIQAAAIHGNKGQGARTKALAGFKNGSLRISSYRYCCSWFRYPIITACRKF
jgi:superfamily II DNA/RNA helicase